MPRPNLHSHHIERHFNSPRLVRDIILGMSDGLTVPFALAAGLFGAAVSSHIIVKAGFAEMIAGGVAMGLGGYLATRSEIDHYKSERRREANEVREIPKIEEQEIFEIFEAYKVPREASTPLVSALVQHPEMWIDFMMRFELGLEKPEGNSALKGGFTIGISYLAGGIIPLTPYLLFDNPEKAFFVSCVFTGVALLIFGSLKGLLLGSKFIRSGFQTLLIGGIAASAAFFGARLFD